MVSFRVLPKMGLLDVLSIPAGYNKGPSRVWSLEHEDAVVAVDAVAKLRMSSCTSETQEMRLAHDCPFLTALFSNRAKHLSFFLFLVHYIAATALSCPKCIIWSVPHQAEKVNPYDC